jgi:hypothetical protein
MVKLIFYDESCLLINNNVRVDIHEIERYGDVYKVRIMNYEKLDETTGFYINLIRNGNKHQIYYPCNIDKVQSTSYAESNTDHNFVRTRIDKYRVDEVGINNFILDDYYACHNFSVFFDKYGCYRAIGGVHNRCEVYDVNSKSYENFYYGCDNRNSIISDELATSKYVQIPSSDYTCPKRANGLYLYKSDNGIEWELATDLPIVTCFNDLHERNNKCAIAFDCFNRIVYNPYTDLYTLYIRGNLSTGVRHILYSTSKDLINWNQIDCINIDPVFDFTCHSYYSSGVYMYPDANYYIAFPTFFISNVVEHKTLYADISLMFSDNGTDWLVKNRLFQRDKEIIRNFDIRYRSEIAGFMISQCGNYFNIYINENSRTEDSCVVKYLIRRDGFTSLYSENGNCTIQIKSSYINNLILNYKTNNNGYIVIHFLDKHLKKIYTTPQLLDDYIDKSITDINCGKVYFMTIELQNAHLYSVTF